MYSPNPFLNHGAVYLNMYRKCFGASYTPTEYTQSGNGRFLAYIPSWWKNEPRLVREGGAGYPLSLYLPSRKKLQCTLRLRGQIHSSYFISSPTYALCVQANAPCTPVLLDSITCIKGHCTAPPLPRPMSIFLYCSFPLVRLTVYHICLEKTSEQIKQR